MGGIQEVRSTVPGAVKSAEMRIDLWFPATWERTQPGFPCLIHLCSLSPVKDDTGKLLSTEDRVKEITYLQGEVRGDDWRSGRGKEGPTISFLLDAPTRRANKITAITGTADVSLARVVNLTFNDLPAINGKDLEHRNIKGLKGLKLNFSIEVKNGVVVAKLKSPMNYASPWNRGHLQEWAIIDGVNEIRSFDEGVISSSESVPPAKEGVTVQRTFNGRRDFKGWSLRISVLEPVESKSFKFDFRGIELP